MSKDRFKTQLSWDDFKSLGNPDNIEETVNEEGRDEVPKVSFQDPVRIYLERKGRRGKTVSLVKGLSLGKNQLEELCKEMKSKCGVGGKVESADIMIQGDQRKKILELLQKKGYKDIKNAGPK